MLSNDFIARANLESTINHRNIFSSPKARSFLSEYTYDLAKQDCLRIFEIEIKGVVVASRIGFARSRPASLFDPICNVNGKCSSLAEARATNRCIPWSATTRYPSQRPLRAFR